MKKKIALVAVLCVLVTMLVSCGNPSSLVGTEWVNKPTSSKWNFTTASEATFTTNGQTVSGYSYTYDGKNLTISAGTGDFKISLGTVEIEGNKFELVGVTYTKK